MKLTALAALFVTTVMMTGAVSVSTSVQYADALPVVCGLQLCSEIPGGYEAWIAQQGSPTMIIPKYGLEQKGLPVSETVPEKRTYGEMCDCAEGCACDQGGACICSGEPGPCMCGPDCTCGDMKHGDGSMCTSCGKSGHGSHGTSHKMTAHSGTMQSETDPGLGHELHQLAVLLPPSSNGYAGILTYSASENVQLVALHGPLTDDEVMGQTIWTPDGETKFALTLADQQNKMGSWMFTGNALAVHTFNTDPFAITYSIVTMGGGDSASGHEKISHDKMCTCSEGCSCDQGGACICSGEAGPCLCGPNCDCGH